MASTPGHFSERTALLSETDPQRLSFGPPNFARRLLTKRRPSSVGLGVLAVGLLLGAFTQSFDLAFLVTNYNRRIASDLNSLGNAAWIVLAGSIAESASQPLYSHIALSKGIETPVLAAAWICAQGLLFCSLPIFSDTLWKLVLSRIVVGLGSSGLAFLTIIIINELVSTTDLALWRSGVLATRTVADMIGGPLGSAIAAKAGWRVTFDLEYIIMFFACIAITISVALSRCARIQLLPHRARQRDRQFDLLGAFCLVLAVVVPLLAISIGGDMLPWSHPLEIAMLCISPLFLWIFGRVEMRAKSPILPMKFLTNRDALKVFATSAGVVFAWNSVVFNLSLYIDLQTASFIQDWALTFVFAARPAGAFLAGVAIKRNERFKDLLLMNLMSLAGLYFLLSLTTTNTHVMIYIILLVSIGFMMGVAESCLFVGLFSIGTKADQSPLYATFDLILAFAADIAIAVSSAFMRVLVRLRLYHDLGRSEEVDQIINKSLESLNYVRSLPENLRTTIFKAFEYSIRSDYFLAAFLIGFSFTAALGMKDTEQGRGENVEEEEQDRHSLSSPT